MRRSEWQGRWSREGSTIGKRTNLKTGEREAGGGQRKTRNKQEKRDDLSGNGSAEIIPFGICRAFGL